LRLLRGEPVDAISREVSVPIYKLERWRDRALAGIDAGLKEREHDPVEKQLDEPVIPRLVTGNVRDAEAFLADALRTGTKASWQNRPQPRYEAGGRGAAWLKVKRVLTLDLIVLAAEWGHGRRQGWLSHLHLGARDPETGQFVTLGKTFKGLTDELLAWQTRELLAREVAHDAWTVYVKPSTSCRRARSIRAGSPCGLRA
jgi:DNA ligase-1